MKRLIDGFLNKITMYRLMLYYLIILLIIAVVLSYYRFLSFNPGHIVLTGFFLVFLCGFINYLLSKAFRAPTNFESAYISALILALIITPASTINDYLFLSGVSVLAMVSKYIIALGRKHIFNPVALSVVITAFVINQSASWWIGNIVMLPYVVAGGLLVVRKMRREKMILSFIITSMTSVAGFNLFRSSDILPVAAKMLVYSPLFFFAFVMFLEPLTTPPTFNLQIMYGVLVGLLYAPYIHLGSVYSTPELALIVGNIFSYFVSPKEKLILKVKEKIKTGSDTYDYIFPLKKRLAFDPGQYMEWTLPHSFPDNRGNRRYFTLSSSPTEDNIRLGIKFNSPSSSFKQTLLNANGSSTIVASQRAGDFVLPKDQKTKLAFMAGGIGITPYRSIIKYLIDRNEPRDITLLYSNKYQSEIVYKEIFDEAQKKLGITTVYILTDANQMPKDWKGESRRIDEEMIKKLVSDYGQRLFYLSGPHAMVTSFQETLSRMRVKKNRIKTDFFPGYV